MVHSVVGQTVAILRVGPDGSQSILPSEQTGKKKKKMEEKNGGKNRT
jgi:hypothetical protein